MSQKINQVNVQRRGHSYGGWLAAYYALENKVAGIILEDPAGLKEFIEDRTAENPQYIDRMIKNAVQINPNEDVLRKMLTADNSESVLTQQVLEEIDARTLIIWGADDRTVNIRYSKIFSKYMPNSRLVVIKGERHTPHYTNPGSVAEVMLDFVRV